MGIIATIEVDRFIHAVKPILWNEVMRTINGAEFGDIQYKHGAMTKNKIYITKDATVHTLVQSPRDPLIFTLKAKGLDVALTS